MYETIYYNVVEYGDVLHFKKKKKGRLYISRKTSDFMFFLFYSK